MEFLKDGDEDFVPNSPFNGKSIAITKTEVENIIVSKLRSKPGRPKTFAERLKDTANDKEDEFTNSYTC
jgi:hypothetical protein